MSSVMESMKQTLSRRQAEQLATPLIMKWTQRLQELKQFSNTGDMNDDEVDAFLKSIADERNTFARQKLSYLIS